jgi:hypothetical protein
MGVPGGGGGAAGGAAAPPPFVGQTKPVGQYSLHSRAKLAYYKKNGTNSVNFVGNSVNFVGNMLSIIGIFRNHSSLPPSTTILESFSRKFFWQRGHNPKKSGKFLSAPLIFSFPYAHVNYHAPILDIRLVMRMLLIKPQHWIRADVISCNHK